jgi:transcriptional regulator with XRE-family HTH domain
VAYRQFAGLWGVQRLPTETRAKISSRWDRATGNIISIRRRALKISQQDMADYMGWSDRSTTSRLERGRRPVLFRELVLLARLFKMEVEDLVVDIGREARPRTQAAVRVRRMQ